MKRRPRSRAGDPSEWPAWVVGYGPPAGWSPAEPLPDVPEGWGMGERLWHDIQRHAAWARQVRAWCETHGVTSRELWAWRRRRGEVRRDGARA